MCNTLSLTLPSDSPFDTIPSFFYSLAEFSPIGMFYSNQKGEYLYCNSSWSRLTGMGRELAHLEQWLQRVHPDDRPRVSQAWKQCQTDQTPFNQEFRLLHPDGQTRWISGQILPDWNAQGQLKGDVGTGIDVTEQKQIAAEARRLESLIHCVNGIVWEVDLSNLQFTFVSPIAEQILGFPVEKWLSDSQFWYGPIHPDDRDLAIAAGCNDYISKPFQQETLYDKMAKYLGLAYLYAESKALHGSQPELYPGDGAGPDPLTPDSLDIISQDWRTELHRNAVRCDQDAVNGLIEQISPSHQALAQGLRLLSKNFEFQQIMELALPPCDPALGLLEKSSYDCHHSI